MAPSGILSGLLAGICIGLIARLLVPTMQPVGCIMTVFIGIVGAFGGLGLSNVLGWGSNFWLTFILQVVIATILVAIVAALFRKSSQP
ncbi:MAG: GlsB/YeaQ/YmgE family stress response membrane protein [Actinomycetales bacterium]